MIRFALPCLSLILLSGCNLILGPQLQGSGNVVVEQRPVGPFSELSVTGGGDYQVQVGPETNVQVTIDDNLQANTLTKTSGDRLKIWTDKRYRSDSGLYATISTPELTKVTVTGSGNVDVSNVNSPYLKTSVTGSGDITAAGIVDELVVSVTGSGDIDLSNVIANSVKVSITGSGDVKVFAVESLDVNITGSGDLKYAGSPSLSKRVTGSGDINQMNSPVMVEYSDVEEFELEEIK